MTNTTKTNKNETDESRRDALKKLGTVAYAAPVMMSLLASKKASAVSNDLDNPPSAP